MSSFIEVPVACETRKMSSIAAGVSSAVTLKPLSVLAAFLMSMSSPSMRPASSTCRPTVSSTGPVRPRLVLRSATAVPTSPRELGTCLAMSRAVSCMPSSASPVAPVPIRISLSMSVAAAPMS